MGHASIQTTYDLYGKLMPESESESAALVDAFLARGHQQPHRSARPSDSSDQTIPCWYA